MPKTIRTILAGLLILPMAALNVNAAAIPTSNGSLTVSDGDDGANHVEINGGVTPIVTILSNADLDPDGANPGLILNSADYFDGTATGLFGPLSGNTQPELLESADIVVPLTGVIINNGNISSDSSGMDANNNQMLFINSGSLTGGTNATSAGILDVASGSFIVNSGSITGGNSSAIRGIVGGDGADGVTVHNTGTLTGQDTAGIGIFLDDDSLVINSGIITSSSTTRGSVTLGNNSSLYNLSTGSITGNIGYFNNDVNGTNSSLNLYNWGSITGTSGTAISGSGGIDNFYLNSGSNISGDVSLGDGSDNLFIASDYTGNVDIIGDILAGTGNDSIDINANGIVDPDDLDFIDVNDDGYENGYVFIDGGINVGDGDDLLNLDAVKGGTIRIAGAVIDTLGSDDVIFNANTNGLIYLIDGLDAGLGTTDFQDVGGLGADSIILNTADITGTPNGAIVVVDGILGGAGVDTFQIQGGLVATLDFEGDTNLDDYVESMRGTGMNMIIGNVQGIQELDKTGAGLALITDYYSTDEGFFNSSATHEIDSISITNGSLYINGDLDETPLSTNTVDRTAIYVGNDPGVPDDDGSDDTFADEFGGTGIWNADITMENGGFSAGQIAMVNDWDLSDMVGPSINSIGTVNIAGSISFDADTFIRYDLSPQLDTEFAISGNVADLITHTSAGGGVVSFDQDSYVRLSPNDINRVVSDGVYVIASSDTAISGIPAGVSVQFNANVQDTGNRLGTLVPELTGIQIGNVLGTNLASFTTLEIQSNGGGENLVAIILHDYAGMGQNANQASIGAAIDNLIYSPDANVQDFIAALDYSDMATAIATIESISPENQLAQSVGIFNASYGAHRALENYLAAARSESRDVVRQPVSLGSAKAPLSTATKGRIWGNVSYDIQDYEDGTNGTEYDGQSSAFTTGIDWSVTSTLILGALISGSTSDFDYSAGSTDVDSIRLALYGTWGEATGIYSNFSLGYGNHDMSDRRDLGGLFGINNSSTDADNVTALATIGYAMKHGAVKHGPYAGFEYQEMDVDDFNVTGGIIPVAVSGYNVESLRGLIGYRAETTYGRFSPYASIAYAHEFEGDDVVANATIAGSPFSVTTDGPNSAILLALGTGYTVTDVLSLSIGYRGEVSIESDGLDSHGIMLGADWKF